MNKEHKKEMKKLTKIMGDYRNALLNLERFGKKAIKTFKFTDFQSEEYQLKQIFKKIKIIKELWKEE